MLLVLKVLPEWQHYLQESSPWTWCGRKEAFLRSSGMQFAFVNLAPPVQILVVDEKREERRAARVPSQSERDF